MRTKKVNNIAKSESESESEILLKQDQQDQECQDSDATTTTTTTTTTTIQTAEEPEVQINITENVVIDTTAIVVEKKKRGRKKLIKPDAIANTLDATESNVHNGDHVGILNADAPDKKEKKPRKVRTSKQEKENKKQQNLLQVANDVDDNFNDGENNIQEECSTSFLTPESASAAAASAATPVIHKKRGRKPRGGKIIHENQIQKNNSPEVPNIILHLKCVLSDLKKSNEVNSNKVDNYYNDKKMEILCYNDNDQNTAFSSNPSSNMAAKYENDNKNRTHYNKDVMKDEERKEENLMPSSNLNQKYDPSTFSSKNIHPTPIPIPVETNSSNAVPFSFSDKELNDDGDCGLDCKNTNNKEIWKKISQLKLNFHKNDALSVQRSSCFWDTCEFDTPPIYIPMSTTKGYGCFCHPECAVAFLMNENIDTSVKFERYHLLNSIYGPIYNYNKSIKPAANPHYLLNKFYGNLTINEYRKLFQCEQVVYMVNKPLTNVLPELYEDNNDFFIGNKIIQNNTIEIKKKGTKNAKSSIINEVFGIR
jgi:hypothetical protein